MLDNITMCDMVRSIELRSNGEKSAL